MKTRIVIMGCGSSGGVPYAGNVWGVCDPLNPKNYRTRPSVYLEKGDTRIVIDTGPDFRAQINKTGMSEPLTAVLYTHAHLDHIMGLDDLRSFWFIGGKKRVDIYGSPETLKAMRSRFDYAFETLEPTYPAIVEPHVLPPRLQLGKLDIQSFEQVHGDVMTNGFRIGDFGYSTDVSDLPEEALAILKGVKIWIVGTIANDAGTYHHAGLDKVKKWADHIKPEMTYLTHLMATADYDQLCRKLPLHIRPAYDGLEFFI